MSIKISEVGLHAIALGEREQTLVLSRISGLGLFDEHLRNVVLDAVLPLQARVVEHLFGREEQQRTLVFGARENLEELGVEREKLTAEASFMEDLGADSLDTVELVMAFEKEFDIDIPDEEAEKLRTVGAAMNYLHDKMGKGK